MLTNKGWATSDGRKPKPGTIPWSKPQTNLEPCTEINWRNDLSTGNGANVLTIKCEYHRKAILRINECTGKV